MFQPGQVFDLLDCIDHATELFNRQVLVVFAVRFGHQPGGNVRFGAFVAAGGDPLGQRRALVDSAQRLALPQVEPGQHGVDLIQVIHVQVLARSLVVKGFQVAQPFLHFGDGIVRGLGRVGVHQLVALLDGGLFQVAFAQGFLCCLGCTAFGGGILAGAHVADLQARHHGRGKLARGLGHQRRGQLAPVLVHAGDRARADGVIQGLVFGSDHAGAHVVVDGGVGGARQGFGCCQVAVSFQHAQIGQCFDFHLGRLGLRQRLHQFVAGRETEQFGHQVGVQPVVDHHAVLFQSLPDGTVRIPVDGAQFRARQSPGDQAFQIQPLPGHLLLLGRVIVVLVGVGW